MVTDKSFLTTPKHMEDLTAAVARRQADMLEEWEEGGKRGKEGDRKKK